MTPIEVFNDSFRMAKLMLDVYRLLDNEGLKTEGALVDSLRALLECKPDEQLQLIMNTIFLGCIRESACLPSVQLKRESLQNLLRQAVVSACTAYETFLSTLLQTHLPVAANVVRSELIAPAKKDNGEDYFKELILPIREVLSLLDREDRWTALANRIWSYVKNKNLGSVNAVETVGRLLGVPKPWEGICSRLNRDLAPLQSLLRDTLRRRNAIVHKADRDLDSPTREKAQINLAWTQQAVDTIQVVCLALDEVVTEHMRDLQAQHEARKAEITHA